MEWYRASSGWRTWYVVQGKQRSANVQAPSSAVQQAKGVAGVLRSTGEAAAAKWSGSLRSKVGRPPPARGAPVVVTAHKAYAREFHTRALQRRLTSPPV